MPKSPWTRTDTGVGWALGLVFVAAGILKVADPLAFALSLARLVPPGAVGPLAIVLPWIEIAAGAALLALPSYRGAALAILITLLVTFTVALAVGSGPCGCFGTVGLLARRDVGLGRNVLLLAAAAWLTYRSRPASPA